MTLTTDDLDLPTLVALASGTVSAQILDALRAAGFDDVRTSHGYLLQLLLGGSPTIGAMAATLGVTQQAVSKSVGELERLGYVRRMTDPIDARARRVELTPRGRELIDAGRAARREAEASVAAVVAPGELAAARRVLAAMLSGVESEIAERRMPLPE